MGARHSCTDQRVINMRLKIRSFKTTRFTPDDKLRK